MYYHASPYKDIRVLEPRKSNHGTPLVYFSSVRENVLVYLSNAIEKYCKERGRFLEGPYHKWGPYGFDKDGILRIEEYYPCALEKTYKGVSGYIYKIGNLPSAKPLKGISNAFTSGSPVATDECEYIEDAYEEILKAERDGLLRIIRYDDLSAKRKQWIRKTIIQEYEESVDAPEYRFFLEGAFPFVKGPMSVEEAMKLVEEKSPLVTRISREEDDTEYDVYRIDSEGTSCILKKSTARELYVYKNYLDKIPHFSPRLFGSEDKDGETYILLECVPGKSLLKMDRAILKSAIDALIDIQKRFWEAVEPNDAPYGFEDSFHTRVKRGEYLENPNIEKAYQEYLKLYKSLPRTLCHDDLLPFNILYDGQASAIIDWEFAGILPYPTSIARLIAHGQEEDDAFFQLKEEDRQFAIEYYYDAFIKEKGIPKEEYKLAIKCFLLYEYCEWIMLGNKNGDRQGERFLRYSAMAEKLVPNL